MWIKCNPNPLGKSTSDCVVRAIAIATEQSWKRTYRELCDLGEYECEMPNNNSVWGLDLRNKGARQFLLPESCHACISIRAFCKKYPEGIYVIGTGSHAVAVIDGDYYDSWDSGNEIPSYFWRVR
jgi:hypothetical protein